MPGSPEMAREGLGSASEEESASAVAPWSRGPAPAVRPVCAGPESAPWTAWTTGFDAVPWASLAWARFAPAPLRAGLLIETGIKAPSPRPSRLGGRRESLPFDFATSGLRCQIECSTWNSRMCEPADYRPRSVWRDCRPKRRGDAEHRVAKPSEQAKPEQEPETKLEPKPEPEPEPEPQPEHKSPKELSCV